MRSIFIATVFLGMMSFAVSPALAEKSLTVDLAQNHVDITMDFSGAELVLFGVKENPGDVAVVIKGPPRDMSVRRKQRVLGAWINRSSITFRDMPTFYDYALSPGAEKRISAATLKKHGIGVDTLAFVPRGGVSEKETAEFREAFIRNKQGQGLFPAQPREIVFLSEDFFKASFYIPPNVTVGDYTIETFYFSGGTLRDSHTTTVRVAQVGLSAQINSYSRQHALLYGFFCVGFAVFAGWISNRIRSRA